MLLHRADMFEALRLTREGKLIEAMTVLREISPRPRRHIQERRNAKPGSARRASFIDLVPPSDSTGAWSDGLADERDIGKAKPDRKSSPSFEYHTVRTAAGSRRFKLYVPAGYHGQPLPLIVMLHGCTQSPGRLRGGHPHERIRRGADVPRGLPGAAQVRQPQQVLELVQRRRPGPRLRMASLS